MYSDATQAWSIAGPLFHRTQWNDKFMPSWGVKGRGFSIAGRSFRFDEMLSFWHDNPDGHSLGKCEGTHWRWHLRHGHLSFSYLGAFRSRFITRCEWCGDRSAKGDYVNTSAGWDTTKSPRAFWKSARGRFHGDCLSAKNAHGTCTCASPTPVRGDYGTCTTCGRFAPWGREEFRRQQDLLRQTLPYGVRPDEEMKLRLKDLYVEHKSTSKEEELA